MGHRTPPEHAVDFHAHAFPQKVAARAVESLAAAYGVTPVAEPTIAGLLKTMDEAGIDISVVAPVATRPDQVRSINDWAAATRSARIVCLGAIHPGLDDLAAEAERVAGLGLPGIKLQPNFQQFVPDDRRLWPLYEVMQGRLVALFHSGQEIAPLAQVYAAPAALARVHEAFPGLKMVIAHMGGYRMWDEVREHLLGRDVYLDSSYCPEEDLSDDALLDMIQTHGPARVVFASDFPWGHPGRDLRRLARLGLAAEDLEAVAWRNACRLLGLRLGERPARQGGQPDGGGAHQDCEG